MAIVSSFSNGDAIFHHTVWTSNDTRLVNGATFIRLLFKLSRKKVGILMNSNSKHFEIFRAAILVVCSMVWNLIVNGDNALSVQE